MVAPVDLVQTSNRTTLSGTTPDVDGVGPAGKRILVVGQTLHTQNGIYAVDSSGVWSRAADYDSDADLELGQIIYVVGGQAEARSRWSLSSGTTMAGSKTYDRVPSQTAEMVKPLVMGAASLIPSSTTGDTYDAHTWSFREIHVQSYWRSSDAVADRDTLALQRALADVVDRKGRGNCKLLFEDRAWNFGTNQLDFESWEGLHLEGVGGSGFLNGVTFNWSGNPSEADVTGAASNANGSNGSLWTITPITSDLTAYSITIKVVSTTGTVLFPAATATYTSDANATEEEICEGLLSAITALTPVGFTAQSLPSGSSSTYVQITGSSNAVVYLSGWNTSRLRVAKVFSGIWSHLYMRSNDDVTFTSQVAGDTVTGNILSYSGSTMSVVVTSVTGSGTGSDWSYVCRSRRFLVSFRSTLACAIKGIRFMAPDGYDGWILDTGHGRRLTDDTDKGDAYQLDVQHCGFFGHDSSELLANGVLFGGSSSFDLHECTFQNVMIAAYVQNCPGRIVNCSFLNCLDVAVQHAGFALTIDACTFEPVGDGPNAGLTQAIRTLPGSLSCTVISSYFGDSGPGSHGRWIDNRGGAALLLIGCYVQQDAADRAPIRMGGGTLAIHGCTWQCALVASSSLSDGYGYVEHAVFGTNQFGGTKANVFIGDGWNADKIIHLGPEGHDIPRLTTSFLFNDQGGQFSSQNDTRSNGANGNIAINKALTQIIGPTAAYSMAGASYGGGAGQWVYVTSAVAQKATFKHQDSLVPAENRFICPGGRDFTMMGPWLVLIIGTGGAGNYVFPLGPTSTYADPSALSDANGTITLDLTTTRETWKTIAATTASRAVTINASAARDGDILTVTRYDTSAFTWTFTDASSGDITTMPAGRACWAEWQVVAGSAQLRRWG